MWFTLEPATESGGWTNVKPTFASDDYQGSLLADAEQNVVLYVSQAHQPSMMKPAIQYNGDQVIVSVPSDPPIAPLILDKDSGLLIVWILPDKPRRFPLGSMNAKTLYQHATNSSPRTSLLHNLVAKFDGPNKRELRILANDENIAAP